MTPFVAGLRAHAATRVAAAFSEALGGNLGSIAVSGKSDLPEFPRQLELALGPDRLVVRVADGPGAWQLDRYHLVVSRPRTITPSVRAFLEALDVRFRAGALPAPALASALAAAEKLSALDDRYYRHVEHAHSGTTGLLRAGFLCSQDCHFCWQGRDWPAPPDELVFGWLDELVAEGVKRLTICGGEPTLWPRLAELIRVATERGVAVHLNTNAIKFRRPEFMKTLLGSGLSSALVSFHSANAEISDRMTRAPGTWKGTVAGIHGALDAGLTTILNCEVDTDNVESLPEHGAFIVEHFVRAHPANPVRMVNYSQPGRYFDPNVFIEKMVPLDTARPFLAEAASVLHSAGVLLEMTGTCGFPGCVLPEASGLLPWRGHFDAQHQSARTHALPVCQGCAARSMCIGPRREYLDTFGGRGLVAFETPPQSDWYARLAASGLRGEWA